MKHNKTNKRRARSGKSPYAKYGKTPHKYGPLLTLPEINERIRKGTYHRG